MAKIASAREAVDKIPNGATVAVSGFIGFGSPDELLLALRERFEQTGEPKNLTLMKGISISDKRGRGTDRLALEGLIGRVICSHLGLEPALTRLIDENRCLAHTLPLGTVTELLRAAAAHRPGVVTECGLGTFADPRVEGGAANALTAEKGERLCEPVTLGGRECLFYKTIPVRAALIRGSFADEDGNISLDREAVAADQFEAAAAAMGSGGIVIAQVEDIVPRGSLDARAVKIHGFMVDYIVKARPENHAQGYDSPEFRPELTGERRVSLEELPPLPLDIRKLCARRAAMELRGGTLINLGFGMPDSVAAVAREEGFSDKLTLSLESGVLGGVPLSGLGLGASVNPEAIYKTADMLSIYDGGGLDTTVLGLAETDRLGNVNVSRFGGSITGPGGFVDISQNTPNVIFVGAFTAGGLRVDISDGRLSILREGRFCKFKNAVEQISFSGAMAEKRGQRVLIVTERAVFRLENGGLTLIEIAPGVELERDILAHMEFAPRISPELKLMDSRIFRPEPMGLTLQ